jgi:hypothetical protein
VSFELLYETCGIKIPLSVATISSCVDGWGIGVPIPT